MQDKDPLQKIWQEAHTIEPTLLSEKELQKIVKEKAYTPLDKVLRNLKYDLIASIPLYPLLIWATTFQPYRWMTLFMSCYAVIAVYFGITAFLLITKEKKALQGTSDILSGLNKLNIFLKKLRNRSIRFMVLFFLPLYMIGFMLGASAVYSKPAEFLPKFLELADKFPWVFIGLVVFLLMAVISTIFFVRWVFNKMYGKHIKEISEMAAELKSEN
ncbi:hypothetical protein [Xanthovirga aplysinae]|uniref:hypothetical protein n=1 Tax=Xanthovirga aplysinae TaxID=2529853 RepID=UPI0012BC0B41|nr:hypothetical protein [Xanthovirga aplysinae]MTI33647.1 hypothetical protein [Xanthovirga aplysinae]